MPGDPGATVVTTLVWFLFFPREAAGAMGTRHSPRPHWGGRLMHDSGALRRGSVAVCLCPTSWSLRKQGPITTGSCCCAKAGGRRLSKQAARRMGPCFRRDDGASGDDGGELRLTLVVITRESG